MKKIYLDYAATTPVDPRVEKAMLPFFSKKFGNTMSLHSFGQDAKLALEQSRETVADLIGAKANEIIFTSSATESNNLALKGSAFKASTELSRMSMPKSHYAGHIIISSIEHHCVVEAAKWLSRGFEVTKIPVDKYGTVNPKEIGRASCRERV